MIFREAEIAGAWLLTLERRSDERGFFARIWCEDELRKQNLVVELAQINTAFSPKAGTLRGMHYQVSPHDEVKLVRCLRGAVYDVAVDLRPRSPTYMRWVGVTLSAEDGGLFYVPAGCAHGYLTLSDDAEVMYLASTPYAAQSARGVRFDDSAFGIRWPGEVKIISTADREWKDFIGPDAQ